MSRSIGIAAAVALFAGQAQPAIAQAVADPHHATISQVTLAAWIERVEDELARTLASQRLNDRGSQNGIVRIKFNCSEDGHADKVTILRPSGSPALDRAALGAVKRIAVMHPLATGIRTDQLYLADILFATEENSTYDRRLAALRAGATKTNGWFKAPQTVVTASP